MQNFFKHTIVEIKNEVSVEFFKQITVDVKNEVGV